MSKLQMPSKKCSIFERLHSADLSLLARKLQEKEQPEQPIFLEDAPLHHEEDSHQAELLVTRTLDLHHRDAELAFAGVLPVGVPTPDGVDPGVLYKAFRTKEKPEHRSKEINLLFGQSNKIAESLARSSSEMLREIESRAARCNDNDKRIQHQRRIALQMAWDYPRALLSLSANLQAARVQQDIETLRKSRFFLLRADLAWPAFARRMQGTQEYPVEEWCAMLKELQGMAETIRRGC